MGIEPRVNSAIWGQEFAKPVFNIWSYVNFWTSTVAASGASLHATVKTPIHRARTAANNERNFMINLFFVNLRAELSCPFHFGFIKV
jgi:hypothetical protein